MNEQIEIDPKGIVFQPVGDSLLEVIYGECPEVGRVMTKFAELYQFAREHKKPKFLVDYSRVKEFNPLVVNTIARAIRDINIYRSAGFGMSEKLRCDREHWFGLAGKTDLAKNFNNREEALTWLLSKEVD